MQKILTFLISSSFLLMAFQSASAGTLPDGPITTYTTAQCESQKSSGGQGGECRFRATPWTDGCGTSSDQFVGFCDSNSYGCCVPTASDGTVTTPDQCTTNGGTCSTAVDANCYKLNTNPNIKYDPIGYCDGATQQVACCKVGAANGGTGPGTDYYCQNTLKGSCFQKSQGCTNGGTQQGDCQTDAGGAARICCSTPSSGAANVGKLNYTLLESIPGQEGISGDLPSYLQRLYRFTFWAIGVAALFMLTVGGFMYVTAAGNTSRISTAKTIITDSLLGIVVALFAWLFLYIINPDLTEGLALPNTASTPVTGGGGGTPATPIPGPVSASCTDPAAMKASLSSGGTVCSGTCQRGKCTFDDKVLSAIDQVSSETGVDKRIIKAIICQESGGNVTAHASDGGCGLMQITNSAWAGSATCPPEILVPLNNIRQGVALYKGKLSAVSGFTYDGGINTQHMTFAAYNCCANGDNPNSQSVSCATSDGWAKLPKWACPIDPGAGTFNMCKVKNYACDVEICSWLY